MKTIQYDKSNPALTIDSAKSSVVVNVSSFGPLTIAVQVVITSAATPSGITATLQGSLDSITYFDVGSAVTLATNTTYKLLASTVEYKYYRVNYARSSGSVVSTEQIMIYGDRV